MRSVDPLCLFNIDGSDRVSHVPLYGSVSRNCLLFNVHCVTVCIQCKGPLVTELRYWAY